MYNKPVKPLARSAPPNRIKRLIVFLSLVILVMFWLFPKTSLFVSLIVIVLMLLLIVGRLLPKGSVHLEDAQEQTPQVPDTLQQDDQP